MVVFKIFSQRDAMLSLIFGVVDEVECRVVVVGDDGGGRRRRWWWGSRGWW